MTCSQIKTLGFFLLVVLAGACKTGGGPDYCTGLGTAGGCLNVDVGGGNGTQTLLQQGGKETYLFLVGGAANNGTVANSSLASYTLSVSGPAGELKTWPAAGRPALVRPAAWPLAERIAAEGAVRRQAQEALLEARRRYSAETLFQRQAQLAVGNTHTYNLLVGSSYTTALFSSVYAGDNIELWVDYDGLSPSAADLDTLGQSIDTIIVPRARALFGSEVDLDGNKKINVLLSGKLNKQGSGANVPIIGFFNPLDLNTTDTRSNKGEFFYAVLPNVAPAGKNPVVVSDIQGTAAHEMQHLISYATHVVTNKGKQESLWLDEGLSHLSEELCGYGLGNFAFVNEWLTHASGGSADYSEGGIAYGNDTAARRGGAMLFLLYQFEQVGGATYGVQAGEINGPGVDFLRALIANDTNQRSGIGAVDGVLNRSFKDLLATFGLMLVLDATGLRSETLFNLTAPVDDPLSGQQRWLRARGTKRQVPGYDSITLDGPALLSWASGFTAEVAPSGFDFIRYENQTAGDLTVRFSGAASADPFLFIVRLGDHS